MNSKLLLLGLSTVFSVTAGAGELKPVADFGANPGDLDMFVYAPTSAPAEAPLLVLMHGCSQQVAAFQGTGFNALADDYGFYIVYPQQKGANNPVQCFNWAGEYGDEANLIRGEGENQSIKSMVDKAVADYPIDTDRVYVAGFSSGGAMAIVMAAVWPDVFRGAAVMSGIPYRCATTVQGAYNCMGINGHPNLKLSPGEWGDLVRAAHPAHAGPWPRIIAFHGTSDFTVHHDNLAEVVKQWTDVHGIDQVPDATGDLNGHAVERHLKDGATVVESVRVGGMTHAVAIGPTDPTYGCGGIGGFLEDKKLCSAYHAAEFLGLIGEPDAPADDPPADGTDEPPADGGDGTSGADDGGGTGLEDGSGTGAGQSGPTVTIETPAPNAIISGATEVRVTAASPEGIVRVEFHVDGVLKAGAGTEPYTWLWPTAVYGDGAYELTVIAFDGFDHTAEASITVTVDNSGATATPGGGAATGFGGAPAADPPSEDDEVEHDPIPFWTCAFAQSPGSAPTGLWFLLVLGLLVPLLRRRASAGESGQHGAETV